MKLMQKTVWAITPEMLSTMVSIAHQTNKSPEAIAKEMGRDMKNTYAVSTRGGVAVIPVTGPLFRHANLLTAVCGATSYELLAQDFNKALNDPKISAILFDVDSPGGEVNGCSELAEMIYKARGKKPIIAYASGSCCSGAYWIASACDKIMAADTAILGSIGVVSIFPRVSYLEKIDTKNTMVYFVDALGVEYLSFILAQCNSNNLFANVTVCRSELPSITCMNKEFVDVFSSAGCKIIDIKDLDELKHHGTNDFDYQITKEPIHLIEELNIIATVLEKIRTNIASGKCEKAIIISDHGASRLAVINETENKYEMSEKGEHSGRCCPVSDIDEKPDFATEENGYWVLANYDRFKGGRKANVEVHGGAALEEVCVPIIEITPQNEKIDVRLLDSYKNITVSFRKSALIKFFINKKLNNLKVKIEGKYYDAQPTAEEFVYQVSMPDIRKAKNYIFDVYASENMIASGLQFNVKSEVTVEKDLF